MGLTNIYDTTGEISDNQHQVTETTEESLDNFEESSNESIIDFK